MTKSQYPVPEQKILGATLIECKEKLHALYGHRYDVRNQRFVHKPGFLGIGKKDLVEVTYVVLNHDRENEYINREKEDVITPKDAVNAVMNVAATAMIDSKFAEMENNLIQQMKNFSANQEKHPTIKKIEEKLFDNEFTSSYVEAIVEKIRSNFSLEELDSYEEVEKKVVDWIGHSILLAQHRPVRPPHTIVLVGPTGVGKTTSLAKIAGLMLTEAKEKSSRPEFCFITMDTIRVGAEKIVEKYADILNADCKKAESVKDLQKIYNEYKNSVDVILIDMSGCSPNDSERIAAMKEMLQVRGLHPDVYLVVSAGTKERDLENIIQNYEPFGYNSIIITKWDETCFYGNLISALSKKHKSISYIADKQKVVGGIHRPKVMEFLMGLSDFDIDRVHIEDEFGD